MCTSTARTLKLRVTKARCTAANKTRQSKSVRFAGTVKVSLKCVSKQELNETWYAPVEYKSFKIDSKLSLNAVTSTLNGDVSAYDASKHCLRGLEACLSPELYRSRKEEKVNIVSQVLKEQLLHRLVGIRDPERLAVRSRALSQRAQERALLLAAVDCNDHFQHQQDSISAF